MTNAKNINLDDIDKNSSFLVKKIGSGVDQKHVYKVKVTI